MHDIFISYAREDRLQAERLVNTLKAQGWLVFWDPAIPTGHTFRDVIDKALQSAWCVVVLWSSRSVDSPWVASEADDGLKRQILVPILIKKRVKVPRPFDQIQTADLSQWDGTDTASAFLALVADMELMLGPSPRQEIKRRDAEGAVRRQAEEQEERRQRELQTRHRTAEKGPEKKAKENR